MQSNPDIPTYMASIVSRHQLHVAMLHDSYERKYATKLNPNTMSDVDVSLFGVLHWDLVSHGLNKILNIHHLPFVVQFSLC